MNRAERHLIVEQIDAERELQERLKANGKFKYTLADHEMSYTVALACLGEELGEINKAVLNVAGYSHDMLPKGETSWQRNLEYELIQLAACCVAWLERFGAERPPRIFAPEGVMPVTHARHMGTEVAEVTEFADYCDVCGTHTDGPCQLH